MQIFNWVKWAEVDRSENLEKPFNTARGAEDDFKQDTVSDFCEVIEGELDK